MLFLKAEGRGAPMKDDRNHLDVLRADHRRVLAQLETLDGLVRDAARAVEFEREVRGAVVHLERQFATHMQMEERVLFPVLSGSAPAAFGPVSILSREHEALRRLLSEIAGLLQARGGALQAVLRIPWTDFTTLLREHIRKEEGAVFHLAEEFLSPAEWELLARGLTHYHVARNGPRGDEP